jgi:hypothetical protein
MSPRRFVSTIRVATASSTPLPGALSRGGVFFGASSSASFGWSATGTEAIAAAMGCGSGAGVSVPPVATGGVSGISNPSALRFSIVARTSASVGVRPSPRAAISVSLPAFSGSLMSAIFFCHSSASRGVMPSGESFTSCLSASCWSPRWTRYFSTGTATAPPVACASAIASGPTTFATACCASGVSASGAT